MATPMRHFLWQSRNWEAMETIPCWGFGDRATQGRTCRQGGETPKNPLEKRRFRLAFLGAPEGELPLKMEPALHS